MYYFDALGNMGKSKKIYSRPRWLRQRFCPIKIDPTSGMTLCPGYFVGHSFTNETKQNQTLLALDDLTSRIYCTTQVKNPNLLLIHWEIELIAM